MWFHISTGLPSSLVRPSGGRDAQHVVELPVQRVEVQLQRRPVLDLAHLEHVALRQVRRGHEAGLQGGVAQRLQHARLVRVRPDLEVVLLRQADEDALLADGVRPDGQQRPGTPAQVALHQLGRLFQDVSLGREVVLLLAVGSVLSRRNYTESF